MIYMIFLIYTSLLIFLIFLIIYLFYLKGFKNNLFMESFTASVVPNSVQLEEANGGMPISVSIIICARNEEKNIKNLLDSLLHQDCHKENLEIIVANDQSEDDTQKILDEYTSKYSFIKSFHVQNRDKAHSPKKNALKQAIDKASGDIILLTDADCVPTEKWVLSHLLMYQKYPETDMVVGLSKTNIKNNNSQSEIGTTKLCQIFENIDFLILMFAAQGAIQSGHPFSCSGQNLSYRKKSFYDVSGFAGLESYISGDDLLLLQKFVKQGKTIKFAAFKDAFTETIPTNSWKELLNQRARWASNLKAMLKMNIRFFIYLLSCFICIGLMPFIAIFLYVIKALNDYSFIKLALNKWEFYEILHPNTEFNISPLLIWFVISPFYMMIVTILGIFSIFKWKDRRG